LSTFARQAFSIVAEPPATLAACAAVVAELAGAAPLFSLHVWVPDTDAGNARSGEALALRESLQRKAAFRDRIRDARELRDPDAPVVQIALPARGGALAGALPLHLTPSPFPGGRARMKVPGSAPSRASMKLAEAIAWIGHGPEKGELCADLGAAPGGWTWLLLARGARVIAVDPAKLAPAIAKDRRVTHVRGSAFDYEPPEPVDWLLCDMVWRPLEVAATLAKWSRRRWARMLLANIKLPMKQRVAALAKVRATLAEGGWREIRMRHLYHDRDEITLYARR
jgi:23S rRNA (cytidine2498-2'-O)-methyltransferase